MKSVSSLLKIVGMILLLATCAETEKPVKAVVSAPRVEIPIERPSVKTEAILKKRIPKPQAAIATAAAPTIAPSRFKERCLEIHKRIVTTLVELQVKAKISAGIDSEILNLIAIAKEKCDTSENSKVALLQISQYLKTYANKIGIILPLSGQRNLQAMAVRNGLEVACAELGVKFDDLFIVKDSGGTNQGTTEALGALVLQNNIGMLITGLDDMEASVVMPISKQLMLPVLILNSKWELIKTNRYAFQIFPLQSQLSKSIVEILQSKAITRVAILRPSNGKSNLLIDDLRKNFDNRGITLTHDLPYIDGDFDSMELAVKKIAGIDYVGRQSEFDDSFRRSQRKAKDAGVHFDSRSVILPANLQTDAVIIPDNFRIVRHFVNLFKYHGIKRLALIGNHEWRSKALLEPWDDFLQGSIFVDFIGTYDTLAPGLGAQFAYSPFFLQSDLAGQLDFRLIGYHCAKVAARIPLNVGTRRRDLVAVLANLKTNDGFYSAKNVFSQSRAAAWPTYHFMVSDGGIVQQNFVAPVQDIVSDTHELR